MKTTDEYAVQISTDGAAEIEGSEVNVTVYLGKYGTTWFTVPWLSYQNIDPDWLIDTIETFARSEYEERKNNMKI